MKINPTTGSVITGLSLALFLFLLFFALFGEAQAHGGHHHETPSTTTTNVTSVTNVSTGVSQNDLDEAISKAMACDQSFYLGTRRYQIGIQGAVYQGESALCVGLAKVVGADNDVMINFSVVPDDQDNASDWGYQGGVLFLF